MTDQSLPEGVERYMGPISSSLKPEADGEWVRHSDYEKLQTKCGHFQKALEQGDLFNRCLELEDECEKLRAEQCEAIAYNIEVGL